MFVFFLIKRYGIVFSTFARGERKVGRLSDDQLQRLREDLLITADILSEKDNVFNILDFEAGFELPYDSVQTSLRSAYLKDKLNLTGDQRTLLLTRFFKNRIAHNIRAREENVIDYASRFIYRENGTSVLVLPEDCLNVFRYLKEKGVAVTYFGFDCALKRYMLGEELLPYIERFSKNRNFRQSL